MSPQPPQQPIRVGQPPVVPFRPQNPFMQMFSRSQAPGPQVIMRKNVNIPMAMMPRSMAMADPNNRVPKALNISPEFPEAHRSSENIVTKQIPNGPTVIGFSLPQLLSKVNSLLPQLSQGNTPRVMEISINRNPFESFEENFEEFPAAFNKFSRQEEMQLPELPRMMEGLFGRSDAGLQPLIEEVKKITKNIKKIMKKINRSRTCLATRRLWRRRWSTSWTMRRTSSAGRMMILSLSQDFSPSSDK